MGIKSGIPTTTLRDHEILALTHQIGQHFAGQNHAVVLAALAQLFLFVVQKNIEAEGEDIPSSVQDLCADLSAFTDAIRALPQDPVR